MRTIFAFSLAGLLLATSAQAALVEVRMDSSPLQHQPLNYPTPNTPAKPILTLDTLSGNTWLDVNLTRGYSYNAIVTELQNKNSNFYGFRIATMSEVLQLLRNHFTFTTFSTSLSKITGNNYYTANATPGTSAWDANQTNMGLYADFYYKFGNNKDQGGAVTTGFYLNDLEGASTSNRQLLLSVSHSEDISSQMHSSVIHYNMSSSYTPTYTHSGVGWMLIQEPADVSAPAALTGGLALLTFGRFRRRTATKPTK
jgi:hypothetical protein